jgi:carbon monoxide dehydrogenase subunit G
VHSRLRKLEPVGEDSFRASLTIALAAITGSYKDRADHRQGAARVLSLTVQGQVSRIREGQRRDCAAPDGATTMVDVKGTVETGGPIARLGQRLIGNVVQDDAGQIFLVPPGKI